MATPLTGQVVVSATPTVLSATTTATVGYSIKAPATNQQPIYLGTAGVSSTTGYPLEPGDELAYERFNQVGQPPYQLEVSDWYVVGTAPDRVAWLASV